MWQNVKLWGKMSKVGDKPMFSGEFEHSVDAKGRLTIPSKYREELGERCVVTRGYEGCLEIHVVSRWEERVNILLGAQTSNHDLRRLKRDIFSKTENCEFDKQGRILLPQELRRLSDLNDKVMLIGVGDCIEIWNKEQWNAYNHMDNDEFNAISESVFNELQKYSINK